MESFIDVTTPKPKVERQQLQQQRHHQQHQEEWNAHCTVRVQERKNEDKLASKRCNRSISAIRSLFPRSARRDPIVYVRCSIRLQEALNLLQQSNCASFRPCRVIANIAQLRVKPFNGNRQFGLRIT